MRNLFQYEPSPRRFAALVGILGAIGTVSSCGALATGTGSLRDTAYLLAASLISIAASVGLRSAAPRGWWRAWAVMFLLSFSASDFVSHVPAGWPPDRFPPLFFDGFMLAAAGVFFAPLTHRDVVGPCFSSEPPPHAAFAAMPALFVVVGAAVLVMAGGFGRVAGPFVLVFSLVGARWLYRPLWALLRGRKQWHAA